MCRVRSLNRPGLLVHRTQSSPNAIALECL
jgi:hypothetical protein